MSNVQKVITNYKSMKHQLNKILSELEDNIHEDSYRDACDCIGNLQQYLSESLNNIKKQESLPV